MKLNITKSIAGLLLVGGVFASCDLDRSPLTSYATDGFMNNDQNALLALTGIYHAQILYGAEEYNPTDWWSYQGLLMLEMASDNGWDRRGNSSAMSIICSNKMNASSAGATGTYWNLSYNKIARCNMFLENLQTASGMSEASRARFEAEARFIRATQYFYLCSYFHDVPLATKTLTMDEANTISKTSRQQVAEWAINEFKEAAASLPKWSQVHAEGMDGRATRQAALAFKGRLELLMKKWNDAANTYKEIIDMNDSQLSADYRALFLPSTADAQSENLFVARYDDDKCGSGILKQFTPIMGGAVGGWCLHNVTGDLFEAYQFTDGTDFSYSDSRYNPEDRAAGRDTRLAKTLYWDGCTFGQGVYDCDPDGSSRDKIASGQTTQTGVMMLKYIDDNYIYNGGDNNKYPLKMPIIRYAEVLLGYVEAKMEAGSLAASDLEYLNQVRRRSGMADVTVTNADQLRPILRHERRVELALEGMRLWDILRWGIGEEVMNKDIWGASFPGSARTQERNTNQGKVDPMNADRWYVGPRTYVGGDGRWPIPQKELDINPNLR